MCYLEVTELWMEKILMGTDELNGLSAVLFQYPQIYGAAPVTQACLLHLESEAFM